MSAVVIKSWFDECVNKDNRTAQWDTSVASNRARDCSYLRHTESDSCTCINDVASLLDYANQFIDGEMEMVFIAEVPYVQFAREHIVLSSIIAVQEPNWSTLEKTKNQAAFDEMRFHTEEVLITKGQLGMPTLLMSAPIDFKTFSGIASKNNIGVGPGVTLKTKKGFRYVQPNYISPARQACLYLDYKLGALGAWGPECKITKIIKLPTYGVWAKQPQNDTYTFTPRKPNTQDSVRFILENGEGKQVDVTINLNVYSDETFSDSYPDLGQILNDSKDMEVVAYTTWTQDDVLMGSPNGWASWGAYLSHSAQTVFDCLSRSTVAHATVNVYELLANAS